jgi:4-hydroxybenzoate polyprenyltransferase
MLPDRNTIKLLRIPFSFFLMPLFLFALSQAEFVLWPKAILSFVIIHLLVYPASNGYNSYIDRDEGSIGGLEKPPIPTKSLFYLTLVFDFTAIILAAFFVNTLFAGCLVLYIAASRAYSSRLVRLKKYAIPGFLTVAIFQGAFTYYMSMAGITGEAMLFSRESIFLLLGCSFQIAGAYPLTQIYQHEEDLKDGVVIKAPSFSPPSCFFCVTFSIFFTSQQATMEQFFVLFKCSFYQSFCTLVTGFFR